MRSPPMVYLVAALRVKGGFGGGLNTWGGDGGERGPRRLVYLVAVLVAGSLSCFVPALKTILRGARRRCYPTTS